jgi:hypothetical protein
VLAASGVALSLGLALVYRPWWRTPGVWITLAAVLAVAAAIWPDLAPLVAQAAVPGLVLAAVAWALRSFTTRGSGGGQRIPPPSAAASSLTRFHGTPSLIVSSGVEAASTASRMRDA